MNNALLLTEVSKHYAGHVAVNRLSLAVPAGTIYGILGPNGAGKSSTLRMVMNILSRDGGSISVLGTDPAAEPRILKRVGYLPEERGLYKKMKVLDVIVFFAALKGVDGKTARRDGAEWLEKMGLGEWHDRKVETLSKGMQQKVQFITTVLHKPDLLILDEPASGLDPVNQEVLRDTILGARAQGRTVVFSTHNMDQAEELCEHVCIIANGEKILDGRLGDIRRAALGQRYAVEFDLSSSETDAMFNAQTGYFRHASRRGDGWEVELADGASVREVVSALNSVGSPISCFSRIQPSLHEIFVQKVGGSSTAQRRPEVAHV